MLSYTGANFFRQRLLLSTLSGKPIKISGIRENDQEPGLRDFEASLLRLLDKISDGAQIHINETGTILRYRPGQLIGGDRISHACPSSRCMTYYLEVVAVLALFSKQDTKITLKGVTNDNTDISVDSFRTSTLPLLRHAGVTEGLNLDIKKRGTMPDGGGQVVFSCPNIKMIRPINICDEGKVKRVRGVAYTARVTPQFAARMVDSARNVLNDFLPDVWIYTDHAKGDNVASSPGYGISLVSETLKGHLKAVDFAADLTTKDDNCLNSPESMGVAVASRLLQEIEMGGVTDTASQWVMVLLCALTEEDQTSRIKLGKLAPYTVQMLRHIKDFFAVQFKLEQEEDSEAVVLTNVGVGLSNIAKKTF